MTNVDTDKFVITDFRSITFEQFDNFVKKEECDHGRKHAEEN